MQTYDEQSSGTAYLTYDAIPPLPSDIDQQQLLEHMAARFTSKLWTDNIDAINCLRQINKSCPSASNQICSIFWNSILQLLETPKTTVCKTMLVAFQEVFVQVGSGIDDVIVQALVPSLLYKTQNANTVLRFEAQKGLEYLTSYCIRESLIIGLCVCASDKNPKVCELAYKALQKVLGAVGEQLINAQASTFKAIFVALKEALTGKRSELKKHASVIVKGVYGLLGDANFTHLIQLLMTEGVLEDKDVENIKQSFEDESEQKQPRLSDLLSRKRKLANAEAPEVFQGF